MGGNLAVVRPEFWVLEVVDQVGAFAHEYSPEVFMGLILLHAFVGVWFLRELIPYEASDHLLRQPTIEFLLGSPLNTNEEPETQPPPIPGQFRD